MDPLTRAHPIAMPLAPFHHALTVHDLAAARSFYGELLGCPEGRSAETWVDYDFFGHQLSLHLDPARAAATPPEGAAANAVDGKQVPLPHFGLVLDMASWRSLADRLTGAGVEFVIAPYLRFAGEVGEQGTMFLRDPSGNALEFKGFADPQRETFARG